MGLKGLCACRGALPTAWAGSPLRKRPSSWLVSEGTQAEAHSFSVPTALQLEFPRKYAVLCVHSDAREVFVWTPVVLSISG